MMNRREFIKKTAIATTSLNLLGCSTTITKKTKPNIILLLADDFGYGDLSIHGNTQIKTPHIDRIGYEGVRMTQFYQSPGACAPTRASLLTGRDFLRTGVWGVHWGRDFLNLDETTIADVLHDAGYATGAFGKWHSGKTNAYFSWNRGFDVGVHSQLYKYWDTKVIYNNKEVYVKGPITNTITDQAIRFIEENQNQPFLCYVPFQAIHEPFNAPEKLFQKYKSLGYSDHVARCYGMIEVLDDNVGRILRKVDSLDIAEDTIIMFMVDDGCSPGFDLTYQTRRMNDEERAEREQGWGYKLRGSKANIWQGGEVSPCFIRWPNHLPANIEVPGHSGVIDIFPTILDLCDLSVPDKNLPLDGKSLVPLINHKSRNWEQRKYFNATNFYQIEENDLSMPNPPMRWMSVHHQNYKLIQINEKLLSGKDVVRNELYNLDEDPQEKFDISSKNLKRTNELSAALDNWYDGIVKSSRAFTPTIYQVGDWNEPASPINLDGMIHKTGSIKRPGSGFYFTNWSEPGSSLTYEINVLEDGLYQVEILCQCEESDLGAKFMAYTEHAQSLGIVNNTHRFKFKPFKLPAGKQKLTIKLKSLGKSSKALDWMDFIIIHRIPEKKDIHILRDINVTIESGKETRKIYQDAPTVSFAFERAMPKQALTLYERKITLKPYIENPHALKLINFYLDFDMIHSQTDLSAYTHLNVPAGKHTINIEFVNFQDIKNVASIDVFVVDEV